MKEQSITSINASANTAKLRLRMAEHILAQYDFGGTTDIRSILNETKVGAWRRLTLQKMLNMVFSES